MILEISKLARPDATDSSVTRPSDAEESEKEDSILKRDCEEENFWRKVRKMKKKYKTKISREIFEKNRAEEKKNNRK